ncbi:unnamed protein product, partial [Prorocentrum cordatum]
EGAWAAGGPPAAALGAAPWADAGAAAQAEPGGQRSPTACQPSREPGGEGPKARIVRCSAGAVGCLGAPTPTRASAGGAEVAAGAQALSACKPRLAMRSPPPHSRCPGQHGSMYASIQPDTLPGAAALPGPPRRPVRTNSRARIGTADAAAASEYGSF